MTDELKPLSLAVKAEIDRLRGPGKRKKPTQEQIAEAIGRTQPYVSDRINGVAPWTADDLDNLAPLLGFTDGFALIASAGVGGDDYTFSAEGPDGFGLAADKGPTK